ncbi:hypothetical protein BJ742DRAFT_776425 [Cladochytrium replicatum]|nr:hypothetical protein BJ742DRAFT_776425 [Cladochytrium replicatum]
MFKPTGRTFAAWTGMGSRAGVGVVRCCCVTRNASETMLGDAHPVHLFAKRKPGRRKAGFDRPSQSTDPLRALHMQCVDIDGRIAYLPLTTSFVAKHSRRTANSSETLPAGDTPVLFSKDQTEFTNKHVAQKEALANDEFFTELWTSYQAAANAGVSDQLPDESFHSLALHTIHTVASPQTTIDRIAQILIDVHFSKSEITVELWSVFLSAHILLGRWPSVRELNLWRSSLGPAMTEDAYGTILRLILPLGDMATIHEALMGTICARSSEIADRVLRKQDFSNIGPRKVEQLVDMVEALCVTGYTRGAIRLMKRLERQAEMDGTPIPIRAWSTLAGHLMGQCKTANVNQKKSFESMIAQYFASATKQSSLLLKHTDPDDDNTEHRLSAELVALMLRFHSKKSDYAWYDKTLALAKIHRVPISEQLFQVHVNHLIKNGRMADAIAYLRSVYTSKNSPPTPPRPPPTKSPPHRTSSKSFVSNPEEAKRASTQRAEILRYRPHRVPSAYIPFQLLFVHALLDHHRIKRARAFIHHLRRVAVDGKRVNVVPIDIFAKYARVSARVGVEEGLAACSDLRKWVVKLRDLEYLRIGELYERRGQSEVAKEAKGKGSMLAHCAVFNDGYDDGLKVDITRTKRDSHGRKENINE